jgi:hypothetical protein
MSHTNQLASAVCQALGMPSRFAAEKEPVSPTLAESTADYLQSISNESLNKVLNSRKTPKATRKAATLEFARRRGWRP